MESKHKITNFLTLTENEQELFMETKEEIIYKSIQAGFLLFGQINYETINGDVNQYLIILEGS